MHAITIVLTAVRQISDTIKFLPKLLSLKQVILDGGGCYSNLKIIILIFTGTLRVKIKGIFVW